MLALLTTADYRNTMDALTLHVPRERRPAIRSYEWLFRQPAVPGGTWVFTDIERLSPYELQRAAAAAAALVANGSRVLNNPARTPARLELLALLHRQGINRFRAYQAATWPEPDRFPVFLKSEVDHLQPYRELYHSRAELHAALEALRTGGVPLRDMLVIEFCATPVRDNVYRKHSVFRVGDAFLSHTSVIEDHWAVKYGVVGLSTDAEMAMAINEMDTNPHRELMQRVFTVAGIDYGRSDFGFTAEGVAVYEINTNPTVPKDLEAHPVAAYQEACSRAAARIRDAIVDLPHADAPAVKMPWAAETRKLRFDVGLRYRMRRP